MSLDKMQELQEQRNSLAKQIKEHGDNQPNWTAEDREKWDTLNDEYNQIDEQRNKLQEELDVQARLDSLAENRDRKEFEDRKAGRAVITEQLHRDAFRGWAQSGGSGDVSPEARDAMKAVGINAGSKYFDIGLRGGGFSANGFGREYRAQSVGTTTAGGHLVPVDMADAIERALLEHGGIRRVSNILRTEDGISIDVPMVDDTSNSATLLAENTQDSEQDVTYGNITLNSYKLTSNIVRVSHELLRDSRWDMNEHLGSLLGERIGRGISSYSATGTGSSQPEGFVTGSTLGVTAASTTAVTFDEVIDLIDAVDPAYHMSASFGIAMNSATKTAIRKLKDSNNQYLWQPGLTGRDPDTILGVPVIVIPEMASMAANAKSIVCGDFSKFTIRELPIRLVRMPERYADYDQVGFVALTSMDSHVIDAGTNPIQHLIMAAA